MNSQEEMQNLFRSSEDGSLTCGLDPCRVTLHIIADPHEICPLLDLYQPVIDWVDPNLKLFRVTERASTLHTNSTRNVNLETSSTDIPALAVMIFLKGIDPDLSKDCFDRLQEARNAFQFRPWRFHHSERLSQGKMNALPDNSQEFFYTSQDLPLWAVRHVHYGREHVRYVLYVLESSWPDQVHFYRLILGLEPDLLRDDFCLFTVYKQERYDVQFSLKKLDHTARILTLDSVHIQVKVTDVGQLVPLFPNVCRPISDVKWQTTDHDGNIIVLDVVTPGRAFSNTDHVHNYCYRQSEYVIRANRYNALRSSSHQSVLTNSNNCPNSLNSKLSELSLNTEAGHSTRQPYSALSDSDDLGIDLPSPPLRVPSTHEEDEESLTLTNTSEESGIQMQQGSEDLSFCEEEPLRSCLNRNPCSKFRLTQLKVRFKEEVEEYEDDSNSRISSGIESEDQSDAEMETRFPYVPPTPESPEQISTSLADKNTIVNTLLSSSSYSGNENMTKDRASFPSSIQISSFLHNDHVRANVSTMQNDLPSFQNCSPRQSSGKIDSSHDQYHSTASLPCAVDNSLNSASNEMIEGRQRPPPVLLPSTKEEITPGRPSLPPYPCHLKRSPPSYLSLCSKPLTPTSIPTQRPTEQMTFTQSTHNIEQQRDPKKSAKNNTTAHKNRLQSVDSFAKRVSIPPPVPIRDQKTKLRSVEGNLVENKQPVVFPAKNEPCVRISQIQNGCKTLYYASDKDSGSLAIGSQVPGFEQDDTTLKFTLKFDTCPTSGLSCRQEQIGFYV